MYWFFFFLNLGYTQGQKRPNPPKLDDTKNDLRDFKRARKVNNFYADLADQIESTDDETSSSSQTSKPPDNQTTQPIPDPSSQTTQPIPGPSSQTTQPIPAPSSQTTQPVTAPSSQTTQPIQAPSSQPTNSKTRKSRHDWMDPVVKECMILGWFTQHVHQNLFFKFLFGLC